MSENFAPTSRRSSHEPFWGSNVFGKSYSPIAAVVFGDVEKRLTVYRPRRNEQRPEIYGFPRTCGRRTTAVQRKLFGAGHEGDGCANNLQKKETGAYSRDAGTKSLTRHARTHTAATWTVFVRRSREILREQKSFDTRETRASYVTDTHPSVKLCSNLYRTI